MSQDDPHRILSLIEKVLDVPPGDRAKALEEWLPEEPELRARVLRAIKDTEALDGQARLPIAVAFQLPDVIGRYQVQRLIAIGGMGEVFEARDPRLERDVVIKVIRNGLDTTEVRDRFIREARAAGQLDHSNIVTIFDVNEEEGRPFIVMEFVRGRTLDEVVASGLHMSLASKLDIIAELCNGLAFAHAAGVIHRDIKPSNVILDEQGHVKILDFGIARPVVRDALLPATEAQVVLGTSGYMAPETLLGGQVDARCDMFAAAIVAYEVLTHEHPFGNGPDLARRAVLGEVAAMKDIPPAIEAAIRKGLAPKPEDRYENMLGMRTAIAGARAAVEAGPSGIVGRGWTIKGFRHWSKPTLGVAAVVLLAATGWLYMRGATAPSPAAASSQSVQSTPAPYGIGSANVGLPRTSAPPAPAPAQAEAVRAPSPVPTGSPLVDAEPGGNVIVVSQRVQRIFQTLTIALAISAGMWLASSVIGVMHRRAYNLTRVESVRSQKIRPPFLKVDHAKRKAAAARGAAYEEELVRREAAETGAGPLAPSSRRWPRRTASLLAAVSLLVTILTTVEGIRTFQSGAEHLTNWDKLVALIGQNKTGTIIAAAVISANVALAIKKARKP